MVFFSSGASRIPTSAATITSPSAAPDAALRAVIRAGRLHALDDVAHRARRRRRLGPRAERLAPRAARGLLFAVRDWERGADGALRLRGRQVRGQLWRRLLGRAGRSAAPLVGRPLGIGHRDHRWARCRPCRPAGHRLVRVQLGASVLDAVARLRDPARRRQPRRRLHPPHARRLPGRGGEAGPERARRDPDADRDVASLQPPWRARVARQLVGERARGDGARPRLPPRHARLRPHERTRRRLQRLPRRCPPTRPLPAPPRSPSHLRP